MTHAHSTSLHLRLPLEFDLKPYNAVLPKIFYMPIDSAAYCFNSYREYFSDVSHPDAPLDRLSMSGEALQSLNQSHILQNYKR